MSSISGSRSDTDLIDDETNADDVVGAIAAAIEKLLKDKKNPLGKLVSKVNKHDKLIEAHDLKIQNLQLENAELKKNLDITNSNCNKLSARVRVLEEANSSDSCSFLDVDARLKTINTDVDIIERHQKEANIEIRCLPAITDENCTDTIISIARAVNFKLEATSVHTAHRFQSSGPLRSIVVRFHSKFTAVDFLKAFRACKPKPLIHQLGLVFEDDQGQPESAINPAAKYYIDGQLTRYKKDLLNRCYKLKEKEGWRFVWAKDNKVFIRKNADTDYFEVKSVNHIYIAVERVWLPARQQGRQQADSASTSAANAPTGGKKDSTYSLIVGGKPTTRAKSKLVDGKLPPLSLGKLLVAKGNKSSGKSRSNSQGSNHSSKTDHGGIDTDHSDSIPVG